MEACTPYLQPPAFLWPVIGVTQFISLLEVSCLLLLLRRTTGISAACSSTTAAGSCATATAATCVQGGSP